MVDFLIVIIEFFSISLTVANLQRYERKSVEVGVFRSGGSLSAQISNGKSVTHQPLLVSENWSNCAFVWCQNIRSASFSFVTKHACVRQTYYDSQDRASAAASHGKNITIRYGQVLE